MFSKIISRLKSSTETPSKPKNTSRNKSKTHSSKKQDRSKHEHKKGQKHAQKYHSKDSKKGSEKRSQGRNKPIRDDWSIDKFVVPEEAGKTRFHDLNLPNQLMHAIADIGFKYCSPIQEQILPQTLQGHDAIGKAQTGTGKTAAFLITIIDDLLLNPLTHERFLAEPRAIVIAPTRELAMQISEDAVALCKYSGLNIVTLFGGADYNKQKRQLERDYVDIVVATPGRLIDFYQRKDLYLDRVESLVLDEADRMLDMGFIPQVKRIIRATPHKDYRQTQFFSATFTHDIINLANQWTKKGAVHIEIEPEHVATDTVEQKVYLVSNEKKLSVLFNILKQKEVERAIIFANRRDQVQRLYERLKRSKIRVGNLSGELAQNKRAATLEAFKAGKLSVLVATDVMGRGIHVDGVTHVINYNLPDNPEDYVHRIGRTGRAGASGVAISLACEFESFQLPAIEELLGEKMVFEQPEDLA